jgi:hypothetical protein
MRRSSRPRRVGLSLVVGAVLAASLLVVGVPAASAADVTAQYQSSVGTITSINVTPYPAASNTSTLAISVTGATGATVGPLDGDIAITMCGNYLSNGTPITPAMAAADAALPEPTFCDATADVTRIVFATAVGGDFSANYTLRSGTTTPAGGALGIGSANTQCLPTQGNTEIPCLLAFGDATFAGAEFAGAVPVFGFPPPSSTAVTPTPAAGRSDADGPGAGTDGTTINLAGVDYDKNATSGTAALCNGDGVTGCQPLAGVTISTDANGVLTGSGKVPTGATTGSRRLVVSTSSKSASATFVVLDTAAITLSATSGGAGSSITVSGSNFDATKNLSVALLDGTNAPISVGSPLPVTTNATGSFSGVSLAIPAGTAPGPYTVVAAAGTQANPDPVNTAFAVFTVSANSCNAATAPATTGNCAVQQTIQQQVNGGNLSMSQAGGAVNMSLITLNGTNQTSNGNLNRVTVIDARGTLTGWTLTGSMADLTTGANPDANHTIPAASVKWTPACAASVGIGAEVAAGTAGAIPTNAALCTAASGGGGGTFTADAAITVDVAASKAAGAYSGKLTLTLTGL